MNETSEIVRADEIKITPEQMEVVRNVIAKGATKEELALYLYDCQRLGVHPLAKLLYFTKRKNSATGESTYTPISSIDFFRARAEQSGCYAGNDDPVHVYDTEGNLVSSTVTVWKTVEGIGRCAFTASAKWKSYYPGEKMGFMWQKFPELMLGKCAEALALRKAFPTVLARIYTFEEMEQAPTTELWKEGKWLDKKPELPAPGENYPKAEENQSQSPLHRAQSKPPVKEAQLEVEPPSVEEHGDTYDSEEEKTSLKFEIRNLLGELLGYTEEFKDLTKEQKQSIKELAWNDYKIAANRFAGGQYNTGTKPDYTIQELKEFRDQIKAKLESKIPY